MGYSCTNAALRALQAVKDVYGRDLIAANEIRLNSGRLVFFERGDERTDGGIDGAVIDLQGVTVGAFDISPLGVIRRFAGLRRGQLRAVEALAQRQDFRPRWAVI